MKWSFNRERDSSKIKTTIIEWEGPFSWPKYEEDTNLPSIPDVQGVYLLTFQFQDGYLLYSAGITNSTKKRLNAHTREYKKGNYTVLDVTAAKNGKRKEIWHGWGYAKTHREEFQAKKKRILEVVDRQLRAFRVFIAEISDERTRERLEAALMLNMYVSKEPWSELADRGMYLKERSNSEMPIETINRSEGKIYGLPEVLEI